MGNKIISKQPPIACAAIKDDTGKIWLGKRHFDIIWIMVRFGLKPKLDWQGFVDINGKWLTREEAYEIARKNKQLNKEFTKEDKWRKFLLSEDLY